MPNYADNTYYTDTYKGAVIDTASFDLYARKATQIIKQYTFNRVDDSNISEDVKMCCCELAETVYSNDKTEVNGNITSEKVGEYSVSYASKADTEQQFQSKCYEIVNRWLAMTGLLYRGCC